MTDAEIIGYLCNLADCCPGQDVRISLRDLKCLKAAYMRIVNYGVAFDNILDEIRTESEHAYADFDAYKADFLETDPDELPDNDFRYGLLRAGDIVRMHKRLATGERNKE